MATKSNELPTFTASDYVKFFGAGALAATSTHGVSLTWQSHVQRLSAMTTQLTLSYAAGNAN